MDINTEKQLIVLVYFSFTSLTTVGFGDYHPKSTVERFIIAMAILFGVMIFSFFMGNFINILEAHEKFSEVGGEGILLYRFFGVLKKFNDNNEFNVEIKRKIEAYFEYRWEFDRNYQFVNKSFDNLSDQLPKFVIDKMYYSYLFKDFLFTFKTFFEYKKITK